MTAEERLKQLELALPQPLKLPSGVELPFSWVRVHGNRAYISGHVPLNDDGSLYEPRGKLGAELSVEQGYAAARRVGLAILGSLSRELGSLDRITAWLRAFGMVNVSPGFTQTAPVINGFSDLILEVFGQQRGQHCRSAVGMAELPFGVAVEVEGEVEIKT